MTNGTLNGRPGLTKEHWVQVIAIVMPLCVSVLVGTWVLAGKVEEVSGEIKVASGQIISLAERLTKDETTIAAVQAQTAMLAQIPLAQQRIDGLVALETSHYAEDLATRSATSSKIDELGRGFQDLRVDIARFLKIPPEKR